MSEQPKPHDTYIRWDERPIYPYAMVPPRTSMKTSPEHALADACDFFRRRVESLEADVERLTLQIEGQRKTLEMNAEAADRTQKQVMDLIRENQTLRGAIVAATDFARQPWVDAVLYARANDLLTKVADRERESVKLTKDQLLKDIQAELAKDDF